MTRRTLERKVGFWDREEVIDYKPDDLQIESEAWVLHQS